jgi:hypothetical protein
MTALLKYDAARSALAEARNVDEVKDIRDKAEAMRAYARMAENTELELDAAELRLRAERRLGELIKSQKECGGLAKGGQPYRKSTPSNKVGVEIAPSLEDVGIDYRLSSRSQKIADISEPEFEEAISSIREKIAQKKGRVSLDVTKRRSTANEGQSISQRAVASIKGPREFMKTIFRLIPRLTDEERTELREYLENYHVRSKVA